MQILPNMLKQDLINLAMNLNYAQCPKEKNKKVTEMMKDKLGQKIMKELVALWPKMFSYIIYDGCIDKKEKGLCIIK